MMTKSARTAMALGFAVMLAATEAEARGDGQPSDYGRAYRTGKLGTTYRGHFFPNTHNPHRFVGKPGVVVRH